MQINEKNIILQPDLFPEACGCPNCAKIALDCTKMRKALFAENTVLKKDMKIIKTEIQELRELFALEINKKKQVKNAELVPFFGELVEMSQ